MGRTYHPGGRNGVSKSETLKTKVQEKTPPKLQRAWIAEFVRAGRGVRNVLMPVPALGIYSRSRGGRATLRPCGFGNVRT